MEVISLTAVLVMGFDMELPEGKEKVMWDPPKDIKRILIDTTKPSRELKVKMTRRKGTEQTSWELNY
jgi:hypothetical protein